MSELVVDVQNVTRRFGSTTAVDGLSLKIYKGESFGFLGPNGAGKTTTIKMLTGFLKPDTGSIRILGHELRTQAIEAKKHIGLVPDEYGLYDDLTAADHLRFYASLLRLKGREREEAMERSIIYVNLKDQAESRVKGFSHGMRQRLVIAQALLGEPDILLLDEPTSGLDPIGAKAVRDIIRKMITDGMTLFISSHILFEVEEMCQIVGIIHKGRLVKKDTVKSLSDMLKSKVGRSLFLQVHEPDPALMKALADIRGVENIVPDGQAFRIRIDGPEVQLEISKKLAESGTCITAFYEMNPNLEDIFIDLVGEGK